MSELKKDHLMGTGASALAGGAIGGAVGSLLGPAGIVAGVAAGSALGAVAGHKISEHADPRGDLGHFEQTFMATEYYLENMTWEDYRPAYIYGIENYTNPQLEDPEAFHADWERIKGPSRLTAADAWPAVFHVKRSYQATRPA